MTAVPFPSNPRRPLSSQGGGISPGASSSPPRGTLAALQAAAAPPTDADWQAHLMRVAEGQQNPRPAPRDTIARLAEAPDRDGPDTPAPWWTPLFWLGALMLGAALWTAVICAILYATTRL